LRIIEHRDERDLAALGDMRPGSLSIQSRKWGGEYGQLSYTRHGKGHTEYVPQTHRKTVERQIANYKKFREMIEKWIDLEIELCKKRLTEDEEGA
jgi:hypothetical protein